MGEIQSHQVQAQYPSPQRLIMSGHDRIAQVIEAFLASLALVALTSRLSLIESALNDLIGLATWASDHFLTTPPIPEPWNPLRATQVFGELKRTLLKFMLNHKTSTQSTCQY